MGHKPTRLTFNGVYKMKSKLALTLIASLLATGGALAQSPSAPSTPSAATSSASPQAAPSAEHAARMQKYFAKMDKNADGFISREEAAGNKRLAKHFDAIDSNKDGKLSKEELAAHHKGRHGEHAARLREKFKAADSDHDGTLSKAEADKAGMKRLVANFDRVDANKDGKVTADELQIAMRQNHRHGGSNAANGTAASVAPNAAPQK
jgi:hypothetical protein